MPPEFQNNFQPSGNLPSYPTKKYFKRILIIIILIVVVFGVGYIILWQNSIFIDKRPQVLSIGDVNNGAQCSDGVLCPIDYKCTKTGNLPGTKGICVYVVANSVNKLKVISPNGGEKIEIGSTQLVTWMLNPNVFGDGVEISIKGENPDECYPTSGGGLIGKGVLCEQPEVYTIARNTTNNGEYNWIVGKDIKPGKYKLIITLFKNPTATSTFGTILDEDGSDDYFEIASPIGSANKEIGITPPQLFSGLNWQGVSFDSAKTFDFQMAYDNFNYIQEPAKRKQKIVQLPGRLWVSDNKNLSDSQLNTLRDQFQKYYEDSLKSLGWDWGQNIDDKQISFQGPSADGPLGSVWGYVKIQGVKLRLMGLSYQITDYTDISNGGPIEIKCPCSLELKVFVSDEADINQFAL